MKLYIVLEAGLASGLKMAQAVHAAFLFGEQYPHLKDYWYHESNNVAILQQDDIVSLAERLESAGMRISRFHEPDLNDQLTAIAVEPEARRMLADLKLAS